jgi:hypothetical protein
MRALVILAVATACTPSIVSGSYLCGPEAFCPDGQVCSGADHICVLPGQDAPFDCDDSSSEPDDSVATAFVINNLDCVSPPFSVDRCMIGDDVDWIKFAAPAGCSTLALDASLTFPVAFQRLAFEVRDVDNDQVLATDNGCGGEIGQELRCARATLVPGSTYGLRVFRAGDGDCNGECAYNSYALSVRLGAAR